MVSCFVDLHFGIPQDWLDVDRIPPKAALSVIQPATVLTWHPVATLVNNSRNKDPQCNKPITLKYVHSYFSVL
jgi:putative SOS response-associated peptidase YedK